MRNAECGMRNERGFRIPHSAFRILLAAVCLTGCASCQRDPVTPLPSDDLGPVRPFTLTERSGRTVTLADLSGKVWIASFQFTRCTEGCAQVTETMRDLQKDLARYRDVRLVTFTIDPQYDTREELNKYATNFAQA